DTGGTGPREPTARRRQEQAAAIEGPAWKRFPNPCTALQGACTQNHRDGDNSITVVQSLSKDLKRLLRTANREGASEPPAHRRGGVHFIAAVKGIFRDLKGFLRVPHGRRNGLAAISAPFQSMHRSTNRCIKNKNKKMGEMTTDSWIIIYLHKQYIY